ncbi:hypothetical protein EVAR_77080_1 [Eumeta japonica]|uniref:Uncharacterized protein n=1 Tax=Eumeta variegata TaxID=151549 RepID=A0A4C2A058_EUMVA|nr:hypothetical protein EVAR_77080_1 [Eumeta japonica]
MRERPDDSRRHRAHGGGESNRSEGRRETLRVSSVGGNEITDEKSRVIRVKIKGLFSRNLKLMTAQTIRNLKLAPQRVERATVAACSHLTDIAENLIYDAAAPAS